MRCPDCAKFVGLETEVEVNSLDVESTDAGANVAAEVHVARNCADCSTELKATDFSTETEVEFEEGERECKSPEAKEGEHDLTVEEDTTEATESGGGRYAKNMVGYETRFTIACNNKGCGLKVSAEIKEDAPASSYEEQV